MPAIPAIHPNQVPRQGAFNGVPIREDILFTDHKGVEKAGVRKEAEKTLESLHPVLARLLEPQETVLYVARAIAPLNALEQLTLGWYAYAMHSVVLVFTDSRLLRLRVRGKAFGGWVWTRGVMSVRWGDVSRARVKGWLSRTLLFDYRNGKKERYWRIKAKAGKQLKLLLPALVPAQAAGATAAQGMVSQCPECVQILQPRVYQCAQCGLDFKNEKTLLWRNFLLPGGGYLYTGWTLLGVLHAIVDTALLLDIGLFALYALRLVAPPPPGPGEAPTTPQSAAFVVGVVAFLFLFENSIAWLHNRRVVREFIPAR